DADASAVARDRFHLVSLDRMAVDQPIYQLQYRVNGLGREQIGDRAAEDLVGAIAEQPLRGGVPGQHLSIEPYADDSVLRGLRDRGEKLAILLDPLMVADVAREEEHRRAAAERDHTGREEKSNR